MILFICTIEKLMRSWWEAKS